MTRTWDSVKASRRSQFPHPLLAFNAKLLQITAANAAKHEAAGKPLISLAVGDPALDGNIPPPNLLMHRLGSLIEEGKTNGYSLSHGSVAVRQAIADYWLRWFAPSLGAGAITADDVIISCGCSDGLSMVFGAIASPGDTVLLPKPFFPQYQMNAEYYGINFEFYSCLVEKDWEIDLEEVRRLVEKDHEHKIRAIMMNNPSNPCGSNWSRQHVEDIVRLCEELKLPIIADEIYAGMTYNIDNPSEQVPYTSVADIESTATRFVAAGASKRFSIPGERMGWVILVDPTHAGSEVWKGVVNLTARYYIPMTALQATIEECLKHTDESYYRHAKATLCENAIYLHQALCKIPGLSPMKPAGGMFMSVVLKKEELEDAMGDGVNFSNALAEEENVLVYPGEAFLMPGAIRLTLSRPPNIAEGAVARIRAFCERHARK